jgi:hypothetical protein
LLETGDGEDSVEGIWLQFNSTLISEELVGFQAILSDTSTGREWQIYRAGDNEVHCWIWADICNTSTYLPQFDNFCRLVVCTSLFSSLNVKDLAVAVTTTCGTRWINAHCTTPRLDITSGCPPVVLSDQQSGAWLLDTNEFKFKCGLQL